MKSVGLNLDTNYTALKPLDVSAEIRRFTHRCRLYRIASNVLPERDFYTEFWDIKEQPEEPTGLPAKAQLVESFTGTSVTDVRQQLDRYLEQHRCWLNGDWVPQGAI